MLYPLSLPALVGALAGKVIATISVATYGTTLSMAMPMMAIATPTDLTGVRNNPEPAVPGVRVSMQVNGECVNMVGVHGHECAWLS